jgi:hypothetical protein
MQRIVNLRISAGREMKPLWIRITRRERTAASGNQLLGKKPVVQIATRHAATGYVQSVRFLADFRVGSITAEDFVHSA